MKKIEKCISGMATSGRHSQKVERRREHSIDLDIVQSPQLYIFCI
jgi:hypothetical protein